MKKYVIEITDANVYINGQRHDFDAKMDKQEQVDDLNKKALLALACEMKYEPVFLFEEMVDRLYEMVDELDEDEM
jgi:hypothetical protein